MQEVMTVAAPLWQWVVGLVVGLYVWEVYLEHIWYKFKHWIMNQPHKK